MVSERELIQKTRESGKEFLRKNPDAFGGGIDPSTGKRSKGGKSTGTTQQGIVEVTPGVFSVRDPTTGKLVVTSSLEFAQSIGKVGKAEATAISKAELGGSSGRQKIRQAEELERRGQFEQAERIREEVGALKEGERTPREEQEIIEEEARQQSVKLGQRVAPIEPIGEPKEAGTLSLTQAEFEQAGEQAPRGRGVLVVGEDVAPADAVGIGAEVDTIRSSSERGFIETGLEPGFRVGLSERELQKGRGQVIVERLAEVGGGIVATTGSIIEGGVNLASKFGTQTFQFDEQGQRIDQSFQFKEDGFIGRAQAKPLGTGKILGGALVVAPLAGAAIAGFVGGVSQVGLKETLVETAGSLSPLKIKPGVFGALEGGADDLKFDVVSLKSQKGDLTQRLVVGRAQDFDDVLLVSRQVSKDGVGVATTDIIAPRTTFRGAQFTEGVTGGRVDTALLGKTGKVTFKGSISGRGELIGFQPGGKGQIQDVFNVDLGKFQTTQTFDDIIGAGAQTISKQRFGFTFDERTGLDVVLGGEFTKRLVGGVTTQKETFDIIGAGEGKRILRIGTGQTARGEVRPLGEVRDIIRVKDFNVRGVEFDISKTTGVEQVGSRFITGGTKTPFSTTFGQTQQEAFQQVSSGVSGVKTFITPTTSPSPSPVVSTVFGSPSVFAGTGQFERTDLVGIRPEVGGAMMDSFIKSPEVEILPIINTKAIVSLDVTQKKKVSFTGRVKQEFDFGPALDTKLAFQPALDTKQRLRQPPQQKQIQVTTPISPLAFDFVFRPQPFTIPFGLGLPIPKVGIFETPGAVVKGDRGFQRTPSLGAVLKFELGFDQPKLTKGLEETGLVERAFTSKQLIAPLGSI